MPPDAGDTEDAGDDAGPGDGGDAIDAGPLGDGGLPALVGTLTSTTFTVAEHMRAAIEMQLSGEPFAQFLGYNLRGFNRTLAVTDQYSLDGGAAYVTDPLAYALAIESYEYSKQPMNNLSFESGAGLSLMFGPVLNPLQETNDAGYALLATRFQQFAAESNSAGDGGQNLIVSPPPSNNGLNPYGWPGVWPVFAEFTSFNPAIYPNPGTVNDCTFGGAVGSLGYGVFANAFGLLIANYECDYSSLNLPDRDSHVTKILTPDALGYPVWKQGLWVINYWQSLQDTAGNGITVVQPSDLAQVGQPGNAVVGSYPDPNDPTGTRMLQGVPGVYLGDIPMEGWQGLTMMEEIDNKAAFLLGSMLTSDGANLEGTSSTLAAIDYAYDSPLLYFPGAVSVVETPQTTNLAEGLRYFPQPTSFSIQDGSSRLAALSGLIGGFAEAFAITDRNNSQVGGSLPFEATFDGDPFPQDDGLPDGESTLHDRSLGVLKVALVNLDRLHFDTTHAVLVDTAGVAGGGVFRGSAVTTVELVECILALRNAFRALNGSLQLYSNDTPDTQGIPGALDSTALTGSSYAGSLQAHIITLISDEADFLATHLVTASGAVANSYDLSTDSADASPTNLEAEGGAIRGLLEAYLATSNEQYRTAAIAIYGDLQKRFWMTDVLCFRTTAGIDSMTYTPIRFALLEAALRQYFKLVASAPGKQAEGAALLQELKRTFKLVVNGWNDRNQNDKVDYPQECIGAGLEMGERMLTGELGHYADLGERDHDCVREISYVGLPAALGAELQLGRP